MARHKAPSQRQLRAGELIRRALAEIINREDLRDPVLNGVSVTISEVRASPDLKHAIVYAAPLGGGNTPEVIEALQRTARFLRGRLGAEMATKFTPRLKFEADRTFETASDMAELLSDPHIKQDLD